MKWSREAEQAVSKVPFFVRKRVRKRVEEQASALGAPEVTMDHVCASQRRFLENTESEVKGHQVEVCFGPGDCPNRAIVDSSLITEVEELVSGKGLREFLKSRVRGPLKMHHEFRVSISDCPNACSRPQIADVGLIAAVRPRVSAEQCSSCGACVDVCNEDAITLPADARTPVLDLTRCVACGQCVKACPTGALEQDASGYRLQLGGKLGRHPRLATELEGIYSKEEMLAILDTCLEHYKKHNRKGERFGEILNRTGLEFLDRHTRENQSSKKRDHV